MPKFDPKDHIDTLRDKTPDTADETEVYEWCLQQHGKNKHFINGSRNHYINSLAQFCNEKGVSESTFVNESLKYFVESDFSEKQIRAIAKSTYKNNAYNFNSKPFHKNGKNKPAKKQQAIVRENNVPGFPYEVFPDAVQRYIKEADKTLNFPVDYTSASVLFAASVSIGNNYKLKVNNSWISNVVIYVAIVGRKGVTKSHPLSFALKPLFKLEKAYFDTYKKEREEYQSLDKEEQQHESEPIRKKILMSDFTMESVAKFHQNNLKGIGIYRDELKGFLNDMNKFRKGSDEQNWLSGFNGKPILIDRVSSESIYIEDPHIPIIGTIQTELLSELGKGDRADNGFMDRFLYAFPDILEKPYFSEREMSNETLFVYDELIKRIAEEQYNPKILDFSPDAKSKFTEWYNYNTDLINNINGTVPSRYIGFYQKLDTYLPRLAIILQRMYNAAGEDDMERINLRAVNGAVKLVEYFRKTAEKAADIISKTPIHEVGKKEIINGIRIINPDFNKTQLATMLKVERKTIYNNLK